MGGKPTVKLNPVYLTGIPGIDVQHEELFFTCDTLRKSSVRKNASLDSIIASAGEFLKNLKTHYTVEETLLEMIGFPKAAEHKAQHRKLFNVLKKEIKALKSNENPEISRFAHSLQDALINHIAVSDREYTVHIESLIEMRKKFNITALKARILVE